MTSWHLSWQTVSESWRGVWISAAFCACESRNTVQNTIRKHRKARTEKWDGKLR